MTHQKKDRKAQTSLPKIIIGMLVASVFLVGFNLSVVDFDNNFDNKNVTDEDLSSLDTYNKTYRDIQQQATDIQNRTSGTQASQDVDVGINLESAIKALNLVWDSFGIATDMLENISAELGIDAIYMWVVIGSLIITVVFVFLSAVLKNPL